MTTIKPLQQEDSKAMQSWHEVMAELLAIPVSDWAREEFEALNELILEAFAVFDVTRLEGTCDRTDAAFWQAQTQGKTQGSPQSRHPDQIASSAWWFDPVEKKPVVRGQKAQPPAPSGVLHFHWVRAMPKVEA